MFRKSCWPFTRKKLSSWLSGCTVILGPRQTNLVLIAYASSESRGTFKQKARSLALLNGWACAVKICHNGMLEDTKSLDASHLMTPLMFVVFLSRLVIRTDVEFDFIVNFLNIRTPKKFVLITLKFELCGSTIE